MNFSDSNMVFEEKVTCITDTLKQGCLEAKFPKDVKQIGKITLFDPPKFKEYDG